MTAWQRLLLSSLPSHQDSNDLTERPRGSSARHAEESRHQAAPTANLPEDAELRMRRALGLHEQGGAALKPVPEQRAARPNPAAHRAPSGESKRRFVQDGEVPVVVVKRGSGQAAVGPGTPMPPSANRLAASEAALAVERAARSRAERALQEALATIRDLQTKLGHAELARHEALQAGAAEAERIAALRAEDVQQLAHLQAALDAERAARQNAEQALREALAARPAKTRSGQARPAQPAPAPKAKAPEPKPVKWWIKSKRTGRS
jgi:hypothetical protein